MKKLLALLLVFVLTFGVVAGCTPTNDDVVTSSSTSSDDVSSEEPSSEPEDPSSEEPSSEPEDTADEDPVEDEDPYEYEDEEPEPSVPLTPEEERLAAMLAGQDEELNKDALYREGNLTRIAKAMRKSKSGKMVKIVCYGNSINTAHNSGATMADVTYVNLLQDWWYDNIGPCEVIAAGGENLTSINASMRIEHDVLQYEPDIVFLDFAVQDNIQAMAKTNSQAYDNIVRRILHSKTAPAVVTLLLTGAEQNSYTMNPRNANIISTAAKQEKEIAEYYDLPVIDFEAAVWDNMVELVQVKETGDIPLLSWYDISNNNVSMNDTGHLVLNGTITGFLDKVLKKLDKISTKDPKYPTEGFYGLDKYMNGSFLSVGDIVDGKAKGYAFDLDAEGLEKYEYFYYGSSSSDTYRPYITTYRHFIPTSNDEEELKLEENPAYLNLTIPEVTNNDTYFMVCTDKSASASKASKKITFAGVSILCYDANGNLLTNTKAPIGHYEEAIDLGRTSAVKLTKGTTRVEFKIYIKQGTVRLLGIGNLNTNS